MRLVTLNVWGGRRLDPLLAFVKNYLNEIDIFCFQEVYSSPEKRIVAREMQSQVLEELSEILNDYQIFYSPHLKNRDIDQDTDFPLSSGIATFIRKPIEIKEKGEFYIYRSGFKLAEGNYKTIPKNMQYFVIPTNNADFLVCNFHGIWFPKDKLDTEDRLKQSNKIKDFLRKRNEKIILCGDFNLQPTTKSIAVLEKGMRNLIKENQITSTRSSTYEGITNFADYILVSPGVSVEEFNVIDASISDHLPLFLRFS